MTARLGVDEIRRLGYQAGWRDGYEAAQQDQVTRAAMDPELADRIVIERLTAVLAQLREQASGTPR